MSTQSTVPAEDTCISFRIPYLSVSLSAGLPTCLPACLPAPPPLPSLSIHFYRNMSFKTWSKCDATQVNTGTDIDPLKTTQGSQKQHASHVTFEEV